MSKQRIKINGGNPVSLCNKCSTIISYVKYNEDRTAFINVDGTQPKMLCNNCADLMASKKVRRTIKSSTTNEHLETSLNLLNQYLTMFSNENMYTELLNLLNNKKLSINV